jgi:hypothetical protein
MKLREDLTPDSDAAIWLQQFASEVWKRLSKHHGSVKLVKAKRFVPKESDTGGILIEIATAFSGNKWISLQLWLDQYLHPGEPAFTYCYYLGRKGYKHLFSRSLSGAVFRIKEFSRADVGFCHLKSFKRSDLQKIYIDKSYHGYYFVGKFVTDSLPTKFNKTPSRALINETVQFFELTLMSKGRLVVEDAIDAPVEFDEFVDIEGKERFKAVKHITIENRSRRLAQIAKSRDRYICQVCKLNFATTYPGWGKGYAEAHHKIPLSRLRGKVRNSPKDLVTVCANCHRMLHWRKGITIERLKEIVKKGRAQKNQSG